MKLILFAACLFLLSPACVKREPNCCAMPPAEMVRTQTQCADAWGYGTDSDETITKLKNYLSQKNIVTGKIELQSTGEQMMCLACNCSNGFVFHVWVQRQYIKGLTTEGFTIK